MLSSVLIDFGIRTLVNSVLNPKSNIRNPKLKHVSRFKLRRLCKDLLPFRSWRSRVVTFAPRQVYLKGRPRWRRRWPGRACDIKRQRPALDAAALKIPQACHFGRWRTGWQHAKVR